RGQVSGLMAAYDHLGVDRQFSPDDEDLLKSFAASAATAVANAQSVAEERLRQSMEAAERERQRWARELHDETLQGLASLVIGLRSARRSGEQAAQEEAMDVAVSQLQDEIRNLRALITHLRPAVLDDIGVQAAIEALVDRLEPGGPTVDLHVDLGLASRRQSTRLRPPAAATHYARVHGA